MLMFKSMFAYLWTDETPHQIIVQFIRESISNKLVNVIGCIFLIKWSDLAFICNHGMVFDDASCTAEHVDIMTLWNTRIIHIGLHCIESSLVMLDKIMNIYVIMSCQFHHPILSPFCLLPLKVKPMLTALWFNGGKLLQYSNPAKRQISRNWSSETWRSCSTVFLLIHM